MATAKAETGPFGEKIKQWAALVAAGTLLMGLLNTVAGFVLINPAIAAMDDHNDKRYVSLTDFKAFEERFDKYEKKREKERAEDKLFRQCENTEAQKDQIERLHGRAMQENAPEEIQENYREQLEKHQTRFKNWGCADVLDGFTGIGTPETIA